MTDAHIPPDGPVIDDARPCRLTRRGRAVLAAAVIYHFTWGLGWIGASRPKGQQTIDWSGVELRRQGRRWGLVRTGRTA